MIKNQDDKIKKRSYSVLLSDRQTENKYFIYSRFGGQIEVLIN